MGDQFFMSNLWGKKEMQLTRQRRKLDDQVYYWRKQAGWVDDDNACYGYGCKYYPANDDNNNGYYAANDYNNDDAYNVANDDNNDDYQYNNDDNSNNYDDANNDGYYYEQGSSNKLLGMNSN